jgi:DNA-binding MarR family transcriptional regulator
MFRDNDPRDQSAGTARDRSGDANRRDDALTRHLALPDGREREPIGGYRLRGSEVRTLATVGALRLVPRGELERQSVAAPRELDRLRQEGLISTTPYMIGRRRTTIVTLTKDGLELLEQHRRECPPHEQQAFYSGVAKPRELAHDSRVYAAYLQARERLAVDGAKVRRVVLETELKREYQRFLQQPNRGRGESDGTPLRDQEAIALWASKRELPFIDGSVRFPDARLEYERPDGTIGREDLEIVTEHYRGAHAAATAAAGFHCRRCSSGKVQGARSSARSGRSRDERLAEEMLR